MAYTQADLDRIEAAIASEELEVEVDGQRTRYQSIDQLLKAREFIAGQLQLAAPVTQRAPATMYFRMGTARDS